MHITYSPASKTWSAHNEGLPDGAGQKRLGNTFLQGVGADIKLFHECTAFQAASGCADFVAFLVEPAAGAVLHEALGAIKTFAGVTASLLPHPHGFYEVTTCLMPCLPPCNDAMTAYPHTAVCSAAATQHQHRLNGSGVHVLSTPVCPLCYNLRTAPPL